MNQHLLVFFLFALAGLAHGQDWNECSADCGIGYQTREESCGTGCTTIEGRQCVNDEDCECRTCDKCTNGNIFCPFFFFRGRCPARQYAECRRTACDRCNQPKCGCDPAYSSWSKWTSCSVSCGGGQQHRHRDCNKIAGCNGPYNQTIPCSTEVCPGPNWSNWTECSDCGKSFQTRNRSIEANRFEFESRQCTADKDCSCPCTDCQDNNIFCRILIYFYGCRKNVVSQCNRSACRSCGRRCVCAAAVYSSWNSWTPCTESCGGGQQYRYRECNKVEGCDGPYNDTIACALEECPATGPGVLGDWSAWSICSETCGPGTQQRTRTCSTTNCNSNETRTLNRGCNLKPCLNISSQWSSCSRSCGNGTRVREISGSNEYQDCNDGECAADVCPHPHYARYKDRDHQCCDTSNLPNDSCGLVSGQSGRVIGGEISNTTAWPWLILGGPTGPDGLFSLCGGSLVTDEWILTAAHCLGTEPNNTLLFANIPFNLGDLNVVDHGIQVKSIITHPLFDNVTFDYDIALLKLTEPISLGTPAPRVVCLPDGEFVGEDFACVTTGWGIGDPFASSNLLEVQVRTLPWELCDADNSNLTERQICAGKVEGGLGPCPYDIGGPLVCQRCDSCAWQVAGIVSNNGASCGNADTQDRYTRVSYFEDWIRNITGISPPEAPFPTCT